MDIKLLNEGGWKALVRRSRLKGKEMQRALFFHENLEDDDFESQLKGVGKIAST